jgi:hypothetical protein
MVISSSKETPMDPQLARWIKQESSRIALEFPRGGEVEERLVDNWKALRPKMVESLGPLTPLLAHVLMDKMLNARRANVEAGMPPTDAREQAERDWLLMEPESEDDDPLLPVQTIISPTLSA